jgi:HEAT repeats
MTPPSIVPSDARPFLRDLNAAGPARRLQGLVRLAERGDWTLQGLATPLLDDPERDVRVGALVALVAIGDRRWAARARAGLADPDPLVRGASAALLVALGPSPDETEALLARAGDGDFEVVRALLTLARRPASVLRGRLPAWWPAAAVDPDPAVRRTAALLAEAAPDPAWRPALETLRADLSPAPFATSALDAWRVEHDLAPRPEVAGRVATVAEAAGRALAVLSRGGRAAPPGAYGWEVFFHYERLPAALEVAAGVWPGLDPEALEVSGEQNPAGHHWVSARLAPAARREGPLRLAVVRRDDFLGGRLAFEPDPRVPSFAAFDAKAAAHPGADAMLLVEVREPGGRRADADRAAAWLGERLGGLAAGPWATEGA